MSKRRRRINYNYSTPGQYFITICTKNRIDHFGKISNGIMELSQMGIIAFRCWDDIPDHYEFVKLHDFVIMPDHIHGIIEMNYPDELLIKSHSVVGADHGLHPRNDSDIFPFINTDPNLKRQNQKINKIIASYKAAVTSEIRNNLQITNFTWQRSFHDRIIRDVNEFFVIAQYIRNNPLNYNKDNAIIEPNKPYISETMNNQ